MCRSSSGTCRSEQVRWGALLLAAIATEGFNLMSRSSNETGWVVFDNTTHAAWMTLSSPTYQLTFSQKNGAILSIADGNGRRVSDGNQNECLWGMWSSATLRYIGGCSYSPGQFSYAFNAANSTLSMLFSAQADVNSPDVLIQIVGYDGASFVDMQYHLLRPQSNASVMYNNLAWPSEVMFDAPTVQGVFLPILPGVMLTADFFQLEPPRPFNYNYPGSGGFAAWMMVTTANGSFAIYDLSGPDSLVPFYWGLSPVTGNTGTNGDEGSRSQHQTPFSGDKDYSESTWYWFATHPVNVTSDCSSASTGDEPNPCALGVNNSLVRRLLVTNASALAVMRQYGSDNGMLPGVGGSTFPSIGEKLSVGVLHQTAQAPLLKFDASVSRTPFREYASTVYPGFPVPSLVHYMAFEVSGFDHFYPDFLPPDESLNSTSCDVANAIYAANQLGHVTMVYENPSWWDPNSPTLRNYSNLTPWAALNASLEPIYETYDPVPHTGIAVSPLSPLVLARTAELVRQFSFNVSALDGTSPEPYVCNASDVRLPMTFVFEDQLGARFPHCDYSPENKGLGYLGYAAAFQHHLANYSAAAIHTEQGVDRLSQHVIGFHGSVFNSQCGGVTEAWWGDANWVPVPLYGAAFRNSTMHFQHNLDGTAMASNVSKLCWSLTLGIHLSLDVGELPYNTTWLNTVAAFQRLVAARFAFSPVTAYTMDASLQTFTTTFEAATSTTPSFITTRNAANVVLTIPYAYADANLTTVVGLSEGGCAVLASDSSLISGFFQLYNGQPLTPGVHALIEDRRCNVTEGAPQPHAGASGGTNSSQTICVYHPVGADTNLTIVLPTAWQTCVSCIQVTAHSSEGDNSTGVEFTQTAGGDEVAFFWQRNPPGMRTTAWVYLLTFTP